MDNRIQELKDLIIYNRDKYWNDEPEISDPEYDKLIVELTELSPEDEILTNIESDIINDSDKVEHSSPVLSLNKVYNLEDLKKWCIKVGRNISEKFVISAKLDGMNVTHYKNRKILVTRGDGLKGEDVTDKLPLIKFEQTFNALESSMCGEVIITKTDFKNCSLKRKDGSGFKTPRNLVSGIMNPSRKDVDEIKDKVKLTFIRHDQELYVYNIQEIEENWDNIVEEIQSLNVPIDGIVIRLQDMTYGKTLGKTSHHYNHSMAFKFPDQKSWAKVIKIDWQVGKRKITPVCYIEPTEIDGVTIKKITLHNAKNVLDMDIREGDSVSVVRRGGVIPYIESSKPTETGTRPKPELGSCPSCGGNVLYEEPEMVCQNSDCDGSVKKKLLTAAKIFEIDGLSDKTISKAVDFYGAEELNNSYDLICLDYDDIIELDGFGEKSSTKLADNIEKVKRGVEDWKVLASLSIEGIGRTLSKQLLVKKTIAELIATTEEELSEFDNMGETRARVLTEGLIDNKNVLFNFAANINVIETKSKIIPTNIIGNKPTQIKTICFSGKFPKQKAFYQEIAKDKGLEITNSVTRKLTYLVSAGASTSKVTKARSYGVQILNVEDFMDKMKII
jgi:DNA ligase (NAD+)